MPRPRADSEAELAGALGFRLRQLRRSKKLTQRAVAARIPMSAGNLSRIENGEQGPPPPEIIERLAAALDADPEELLAVAGRSRNRDHFEQLVLSELRDLRAEVRAGFERMESALTG